MNPTKLCKHRFINKSILLNVGVKVFTLFSTDTRGTTLFDCGPFNFKFKKRLISHTLHSYKINSYKINDTHVNAIVCEWVFVSHRHEIEK